MSEQALMTQATNTLARVDEKTIDDFLFSERQNFTDQEKTLFKGIALASGLNPFKREIHAARMGGRLVVITGYEVYIKRAERTGLLEYWDVRTQGKLVPTTWLKTWWDRDKRKQESKQVEGWKSDPNDPFAAIVTIKRKDRPHPQEWEVDFPEVCMENENWGKRPRFMTKKVAICQGFRLIFPEECDGLPYATEELDGRTEEQVQAMMQEKHAIEHNPFEEPEEPETVDAEVIPEQDPPKEMAPEEPEPEVDRPPVDPEVLDAVQKVIDAAGKNGIEPDAAERYFQTVFNTHALVGLDRDQLKRAWVLADKYPERIEAGLKKMGVAS